MRKFLVLFCFFNSLILFSQIVDNNNKLLDSSAVLFKARLFTIEREGVVSDKVFFETINTLECKKYISKNFYYIIIKAPDYLMNYDYEKTAIFGECSYYIAYSIKDNKYYKLGGFDTNNTNEFAKKFISSTDAVNYREIVKDASFIDYLRLILSKKNKKAAKFFPMCSEVMEKNLIIE